MLDWYAATAIEHRETPEVLVRAMRDERENLLRAFAYSAALGRWERGIELATEVVGGVFGLGGKSEAVLEWVREAEALGGGLSPYAQAQLALTPAPRETPQADQAQQALALARASGDRRLLCRALQDVAWVALEEERLAVADAAMAELSTLEPLPPLIQVNLLLNRAEMAETRGEVAAAEEAWAEAETAARATGDQTDLVRCFWYAAGAALAHGDSARAHALLTEALAADATWTSWPTVELALRYSTAVAAALEGKTREAAEHLQRALLVFDRVGSFDRLVELPAVILTASLVTARSGHRDASAALLAWAAARIDAPGHDTFALKAQREALGSPDLTPTDARDDAEILRLALDAVATVLAPAS
jgi:tetratricopeptide (TPR) repeat protein